MRSGTQYSESQLIVGTALRDCWSLWLPTTRGGLSSGRGAGNAPCRVDGSGWLWIVDLGLSNILCYFSAFYYFLWATSRLFAFCASCNLSACSGLWYCSSMSTSALSIHSFYTFKYVFWCLYSLLLLCTSAVTAAQPVLFVSPLPIQGDKMRHYVEVWSDDTIYFSASIPSTSSLRVSHLFPSHELCSWPCVHGLISCFSSRALWISYRVGFDGVCY